LDGGLATYLGWLIPWGTPVTLIADSTEEIIGAQRELSRIGIDRPAAFATTKDALGDPGHVTSFPVRRFSALGAAALRGKPRILDVRHHHERRHSAIPGSIHVPLPELTSRLAELEPGAEVWVHCAGGYRASVAAGILSRAGHAVIAIDDDYANAQAAGLLQTGFQAA
jgi:rhodanese-related sulfurtransferase